MNYLDFSLLFVTSMLGALQPMDETVCYECDPITCYDCDKPIYENDADFVCEVHMDVDAEYCSCDDYDSKGNETWKTATE